MADIEELKRKISSHISGNPIEMMSDADLLAAIPDDVLLAQISSDSQQPVSGYEQAIQKTEQQISERPSAISYLRDVAKNPQLVQQHPFRTGLSAIAAPFEAGESIPANIGLAMQRGDLSQLPQQLWQGVSGERPSQIGDIYRASGVPLLQAMAAPAGLLLTGGTNIKALSQSPVNRVSRLGDEAIRPALKLAQAIRSTTSAPSKITGTILGQVPKIGREFVAKPVARLAHKIADPVVDLPYVRTLQVREKLAGYFRKINEQYGDDIENLSKDLKGVFPADEIANSFKIHLQEAGILDMNGNEISDRIADLTRQEKKMLDTYMDVATMPGGMIEFKDVLNRIKQLRSTVRPSAQAKNVPINAGERVVYGVLHDIANKLSANSNSLEKINAAYAPKRQLFTAANKLFGTFKGEFETKTGERLFSHYHRLDEVTKKLLEKLEKELNFSFIKDASTRSALWELTEWGNMGHRAGAAAELIGKGAGAAMAAPFTMKPQIQQAAIREVLKMLGASTRLNSQPNAPTN